MPESNEFGMFWGSTLYDYTDTKEPVIDNILYEKDVICIDSHPGCGKSILLLQLLCNLTTGEPFLGIYEIHRTCNVLYVQTEGDRAETLERIKNMKKAAKLDDTKWGHLNLPSLALNTPQGLRIFLEEATKSGINWDLIIIDPLYTTVKGSMCDDEVATDWVRNVREIRKVFGCMFIVAHHRGKELYFDGKAIDTGNANIFGSVFWGAFLNTNYRLKLLADGVRTLNLGKERKGIMIDNIPMKLVEPSPLLYVPSDHATDSRLKVEFLMRNKSSEWFHMKILESQTTLSRATVYRVLRELYIEGLIEKRLDGTLVYYKWKVERHKDAESTTSMRSLCPKGS